MKTQLIIADILEDKLGEAKNKTDILLYTKVSEIMDGFTYAVMEDTYGLCLESKKKANDNDDDDDEDDDDEEETKYAKSSEKEN